MKKLKKIELSEGIIEARNEIGNYTFVNEFNIKEIWIMAFELQKKVNEIIDLLEKKESEK